MIPCTYHYYVSNFDCLTVCRLLLTGGWREDFVQLDFSAAFDRISHCGRLYKLRSIGAGELILFILSEFLSDRWQRVRLDEKIRASVDVVLAVPQGSVLGPFLSMLYTFELLHIVRNHIVYYADDTTIYAVILDHSRVLK